MDIKDRIRERLVEKLCKDMPRGRPTARFIDGKFLRGVTSMHWTPQARRLHILYRIRVYLNKI